MMTSNSTQNEVSHVPLASKILDRLPKPEEKDMEEEEIANAYTKSDVISAVDAQFASNKVTDSTDSDYVDGADEYEQEEKDLLDDEYDSVELEASNESETNVEFDEQLSEAIIHIQTLAANDQKEIIATAMGVYKDEYGEDISSKTLADAFKLVKLQLFENYAVFDDESDESYESETDEDDSNEEEEKQDILEDDEKEVNINEEEEEEEEFEYKEKIKADFAEAFEAISLRASIDQELLVNSICDTFVDFNGVEPEINELSDIFSRIKNRFAQEAQDEIFDSVDSSLEEEEEEENEYEMENESDDENDSDYDPDKDSYNYENDYSDVTESSDDQVDDEQE